VSAPAAIRCPRCSYLPASATILCLQCRSELRETGSAPQCPYTHEPCHCGLRAYCVGHESWHPRFQ
jgi:hypothetical protein